MPPLFISFKKNDRNPTVYFQLSEGYHQSTSAYFVRPSSSICFHVTIIAELWNELSRETLSHSARIAPMYSQFIDVTELLQNSRQCFTNENWIVRLVLDGPHHHELSNLIVGQGAHLFSFIRFFSSKYTVWLQKLPIILIQNIIFISLFSMYGRGFKLNAAGTIPIEVF